jgi:hypothetical protein
MLLGNVFFIIVKWRILATKKSQDVPFHPMELSSISNKLLFNSLQISPKGELFLKPVDMNDRQKTTKCIAPRFYFIFRLNWGNRVNKCSEGDNG